MSFEVCCHFSQKLKAKARVGACLRMLAGCLLVLSPTLFPTVVLAADDGAADKLCPVRSIAKDPNRTDGYRAKFAFVSQLQVAPGQLVTFPCARIAGLEGLQTIKPARRSLISINGGAFRPDVQAIADNDTIRVQIAAPVERDALYEEGLEFDGKTLATFALRVINTDRAPKRFQVGPGRQYRELADLAPELRAGDIVEVDPGEYKPVTFTRSGTAASPIIVKSAGADRPVIRGGTHAVHFKNANFVEFEGFVVTAGEESCIRSMAHGVVVRRVLVQDCPRHGILGSDLGSGSITIDRTEITRVGANRKGMNTKHAIYVATDRDAFPGSVLRVTNSFIHDYLGGGIKSRSARTEVFGNWIEAMDHPETLYTLELYGYEEYVNTEGLQSDVVGNVLIHKKVYGLRLGGDGTGASKGRVRLASNYLIFHQDRFANNPAMRLFQSIDSVYLENNVFSWAKDSSGPIRLFRDDISEVKGWREGRVKLAGIGNLMPSGSDISPASTGDFKSTIFGRTGWQLGADGLTDLGPSVTQWQNSQNTKLKPPIGFEIETPSVPPAARKSLKRPVSGQAL
jgi:hypothetical protein